MSNRSTQVAAMQALQGKIDYQFTNIELLKQALTHRSYNPNNNERLEFIGDSILDYTIARMLFDAYPKLPEGHLSRMRANLVNQTVLAEIAMSLNLGSALFLGMGELKSGGHQRPSILSDALEALFAAVCLDSSFERSVQLVESLFAQRVLQADKQPNFKDPKTSLQEALQARRFAVPKYRIEEQVGEGNQAVFKISCDLGELGHITYASASSRRAAEQEAAKMALEWLEQQKIKK